MIYSVKGVHYRCFGIGVKFRLKKNHKPAEYGKDFMKIRSNSDNNLPLNKRLRLHNLTIIVRCVFQEDNKYYPQAILNECLCDF